MRLPWSGVLTMVRRARRVLTQQLGGRAYHGQACAQCCNEALTMVRPAKTKQSSGCGYVQCQGEAVVCGRAMQGCRKKVHAVERGFWSAGINTHITFCPAHGAIKGLSTGVLQDSRFCRPWGPYEQHREARES